MPWSFTLAEVSRRFNRWEGLVNLVLTLGCVPVPLVGGTSALLAEVAQQGLNKSSSCLSKAVVMDGREDRLVVSHFF